MDVRIFLLGAPDLREKEWLPTVIKLHLIALFSFKVELLATLLNLARLLEGFTSVSGSTDFHAILLMEPLR